MRNMRQRLKEHGAVREHAGVGYAWISSKDVLFRPVGWDQIEPRGWLSATGYRLLSDQDDWTR